MKTLLLNLKSIVYKRRALAIILLPFVIAGLFFVYKNSNTNDIYATDPMIVTYNGNAPPDPMFSLTDMKPGDVYERCFNVKNGSTETFAVEMTSFKSLEEKDFSKILDLLIYDSITNDVIFSGLLKDFFSSPPFNLGDFSAGSDRTFCIKVSFPPSAGNEYQQAKVIFYITWRTEIPESDIPDECEDMAGKFESVIYGTEGNDRIHGNIYSNLIYALGGDDVVDSSASDDCVVLGDGNDKVDSEGGNDVILGGGGNDKIYSGSGNDRVYAGDGNDIVISGSGNDLVYGGAGNDTIDLGSGFDTAYGEGGNDKIKGGSNDDYLDGGLDIDILNGNGGNDTCKNGETVSYCEL